MRDAILIGLILAAIILVLFLRIGGERHLVAGLVIPVTVAMTFIALKSIGESFNLMTLGGLAAAVGLVIDDAIVVVENIVLHRDAGENRADAIRKAIREIRRSAGRFHYYANRRVLTFDHHYGRNGDIVPRSRHYGCSGPADIAGVGIDVDADTQPSVAAIAGQRRETPEIARRNCNYRIDGASDTAL